KDVLLTALQEYTGTVVFVSHDRYFLDKLATRVFEVEDGRVHIFPGNYEDYVWRKNGGGPLPMTAETAEAPASAAQPTAPVSAGKRLNPIKIRQMEQRRSSVEEDVARLEGEIAGLETELFHFVSVEETARLSALL